MQPPDDIIRGPVAAGIAGALIGLRWAPGASWGERMANVASGSAIAGYVGPLACELLDLGSPKAQAAVGFGLGLFGISLATTVLTLLRDLKLAEILTEKLRGGGKS